MKLCSEKCFSTLDSAQNRHQLLLKEGARIRWENPTLNKQLEHAELALWFNFTSAIFILITFIIFYVCMYVCCISSHW